MSRITRFRVRSSLLEVFERDLPKAEVLRLPQAGHYVLEDEAPVLVPAIRAFLDRHPL